MRNIAGVVIDSCEFAREQHRLVGELAVAELPRLADMLAENAGVLSCRLDGERGEQGRLLLRLSVEGEVRLKCQRCLGPLPYPLSIASCMQLVAAGDSWPDEALADDTADAIEALSEQPVLSLIEEEVLLALPIAPRHEACNLPAGGEPSDRRESPFAVLASLKRH